MSSLSIKKIENSVEESAVELFVPGRICLLGEHSDWAGGFRASNKDLEMGYCMVK